MSQYALRAGAPIYEPDPIKQIRSPKTSKPDGRVTSPHMFVTFTLACVHCDGNHHIEVCFKFKRLSVQERTVVVNEKNLCYRCLFPSHRGAVGRKGNKCEIASFTGRHHTLLHGAPRIYPIRETKTQDQGLIFRRSPSPIPDPDPVTSSNNQVSSFSVLRHTRDNCGTMLPTFQISLRTKLGKVPFFALLDLSIKTTIV